MTVTITAEQIAALAPDASSLQTGRKLANNRSWQSCGQNDNALWGECKGSAAAPYRTQIDLSGGVATRCSCPSRKFPCKHAIGLLLLRASEPQLFPSQAPPPWVAEWLASRSAKRAAAAAPAEATPKTTRSSTARSSAREARVATGLEDLRRWLHDLVRQGLAAAQQQPFSFWEQTAARLVDAQAPGLARYIRAMPSIIASGQDWQERLLERLGRVYLAIEGYERLENLPKDTQADLRTAIGWTYSRDDLLAEQGIADQWQIIGRRVFEEDGFSVQRTWLRGSHSNRDALILDFATAYQPLDRTLVPGTTIETEVVFYPSAAPLRALVKPHDTMPQPMALPNADSLDTALGKYADAASRNPWTEQFPLLLRAQPRHESNQWQLQVHEHMLPIMPHYERGWQLLALSGGQPITVCGEWDGVAFVPLYAWAEDAWREI